MLRKLAPVLALLMAGAGCGYRRLDRRARLAPWMVKGETIRIASFRNQTTRLGLEEPFKKALENRLVAASPWKLVTPGDASRWVLQATLDRYEVRPLGLTLGNAQMRASAGNASRIEITVVGSVQLLDGLTGAVAISRRALTFSSQYRVDENFASFDNRELQVLEGLADDFAESFLTQLLEGSD